MLSLDHQSNKKIQRQEGKLQEKLETAYNHAKLTAQKEQCKNQCEIVPRELHAEHLDTEGNPRDTKTSGKGKKRFTQHQRNKEIHGEINELQKWQRIGCFTPSCLIKLKAVKRLKKPEFARTQTLTFSESWKLKKTC